jgi:hypothetical protein
MKTLLLLSLLSLVSCAQRNGSQLHATAPGTQQRSGTLALDLRTDKTKYKAGEPIKITLTSSQPAKVEIYSLDAQGHRTAVWPRPGAAAVPVRANVPLLLPPEQGGWNITAAAPLGVNTLVATATAISPAAPTANPARPEFFQIHNDGWKGMSVKPTQDRPEPTNTRSKGEVRWLYEVQ